MQEDWLCPPDKTCVLEKCPLGVTYGVAGHEFNVNELTVSTSKVSLSKPTENKVLWLSGDKDWWLAGTCPYLSPFVVVVPSLSHV